MFLGFITLIERLTVSLIQPYHIEIDYLIIRNTYSNKLYKHYLYNINYYVK